MLLSISTGKNMNVCVTSPLAYYIRIVQMSIPLEAIHGIKKKATPYCTWTAKILSERKTSRQIFAANIQYRTEAGTKCYI